MKCRFGVTSTGKIKSRLNTVVDNWGSKMCLVFRFVSTLSRGNRLMKLQHKCYSKSFANLKLKIMSNTEMSNKRLKINKNLVKIGTHDGVFHCDEALACFILKQLPEYKEAEIVRSRNSDVLADCDVVVDVGAIFNVATNRYDHHQNTFTETFSSLRPEFGDTWNIRLSSAGLVYTHFGERAIQEILLQKKNYEITKEELRNVYVNVYKNFIREIDGIDNGVPMFEKEPSYTINTNLSNRVGRLNPNWINEKDENVDQMELFQTAMQLTGSEFVEEVLYNTFVWWPARSIVELAIKSCYKIHESGEILELQKFCPWKHHLYELESSHNIIGLPKYVIFEGKPNDWRVICVPNQPESYVCRKFLHPDWRGVRDNDLATISGIPDATFCHATGFIGGSKTKTGALQMAIKSLEGNFVD